MQTSKDNLIPKNIHFSVPDKISDDMQRVIDMATKNSPGWNIKVWRDGDLNKKDFKLSHLWDTAPNGAALSDLIRLELVFNHGGFYLDNDFELYRDLNPLRKNQFVISTEDGVTLTNAFFGATINNHLVLKIINDLETFSKYPDILAVHFSGPTLFSKHLTAHRKEILILPRPLIYPHRYLKKNHYHGFGKHLFAATWIPNYSHNHEKIVELDRGFKLKNPHLKFGIKKFKRWVRHKIEERKQSFHLLGTGKSYAFDNNTLVARVKEGFIMFLKANDLSLTPHLTLNVFEADKTKFIHNVLGKGEWFIDVGANVGYYTMLAANAVGKFGKVISFEPNKEINTAY